MHMEIITKQVLLTFFFFPVSIGRFSYEGGESLPTLGTGHLCAVSCPSLHICTSGSTLPAGQKNVEKQGPELSTTRSVFMSGG